jgi:hypothetical protein
MLRLSLERVPPRSLEALEVQCGLWPGVIAAAVYVPLTADGDVLQPGRIDDQGFLAPRNITPMPLSEPLGVLAALHQRMEDKGALMGTSLQ